MPAVIALALLACAPRRTVPLHPGSYVGDAGSGVRLELDLDANLLRLRSANEVVELKLERIDDPRDWPADCDTMRGPARVELARIVPPGFTLDGVRHEYDGVRAGCGASIELVESGRSETWRFGPSEVAGDQSTPQ